jgi:hypothetical protein
MEKLWWFGQFLLRIAKVSFRVPSSIQSNIHPDAK